jgi:hypothetical protein
LTSNSQTAESTANTNTNTNGQTDCPDLIDRCTKLCGEGLVKSCSCKKSCLRLGMHIPQRIGHSCTSMISRDLLRRVWYIDQSGLGNQSVHLYWY